MSGKHCYICKGKDNRDDPLFEDSFYPDIRMHLKCLNSKEAIAWRKKKMNEDPLFRRYIELISMGRKMRCSACSETNYLYLKCAERFSPSWELCCDECHRVDLEGLSPYEFDVNDLSDLSDDFCIGKRELSDEWSELEKISDVIESRRGFTKCECGGSFTVLGKPRCWSCGEVVYDTVFHYAHSVGPVPGK